MGTTVSAFADTRPAIVLLGDSITEEGGAMREGWTLELSTSFSRHADVLNRGFGGYNTRWALKVFERLWPPHESTALATIWFGANDAVHAELNPLQHVPLEEFKANLAYLVSRTRRRCARVVVISPLPVHEATYEKNDRTLADSGAYARAACEVASIAGCAFLDLWTKFQEEDPGMPGEGGPQGQQPWGRLLRDGLHPSAEGHHVIARELLALLEQQFPDLLVKSIGDGSNGERSAALQPHLPCSSLVTEDNQDTIFGEEEAAAGDMAQFGSTRTYP